MKSGLGADAQDGWLLLGGPGESSASSSLSVVIGPGGSSALSYHPNAVTVAAAGRSSSGGPNPGDGRPTGNGRPL